MTDQDIIDAITAWRDDDEQGLLKASELFERIESELTLRIQERAARL